MSKLVWIIAFHCMLTVVARADFRVLERNGGILHLLISGTITERDAKAVQELSAELERDSFNVMLDSRGGDLFAAMRIGRLIRKNEGRTEIWDPVTQNTNVSCYSSCALIFIAGVTRYINPGGLLGLHRPYLASAPQSRQAIEKQVPLILLQVKQYVAEMGITDNFYQQMVNTEPSQMVLYGAAAEDAKRVGFYGGDSFTKLVPKYDPVHQEVETSYDARRYGVSTYEMRQRENDAKICSKREDSYNCKEALRWGLSERLYRERDEKARQVCVVDDDVRKLLLGLPKKERIDHPLWIKRETCIRAIMLGGA